MLSGSAACGDPQGGPAFTFDPVPIYTVLASDAPFEEFRGAPVYLDEDCGVHIADRIGAVVLEDSEPELNNWIRSVGFEVIWRDPADTTHGPAVWLQIRVPAGSAPDAAAATSARMGVLVASPVGLVPARNLGFPCTPTARQ